MKLLGGNQVASLFSSWTNTYVSIQSIMVVNNFDVGGLANKFFSLARFYVSYIFHRRLQL
jgi:hypothetical protein